jgi:predicted dehydrogenase
MRLDIMNTIRVAVVGIGYWGPNIVRNFLKIPKVEVSCVCDLSVQNLSKFSASYPFIPVTRDYKKILKNKNIDLVAIVTPVVSHFTLAKQALLSKKHVLLEKPMTKTSDEAKELITLAQKQNRGIFVGHTFVYNGAIQMIKNYISSGKLGKILYFDSIRINTKLIRDDVNVIWDLAPHDLSIINYLFEKEPVSVSAFGTSRKDVKNREIAHLIISYPEDLTAHVHVNWLSPVKIRKILIGGSKRMIVYDDLEPSEKIRIYDENIPIKASLVTPFSPAWRSGDVLIPHFDETEALYKELLHFIDCLRNHKKPLTGGYEGLQVVKLLEASDKALKIRLEVNL